MCWPKVVCLETAPRSRHLLSRPVLHFSNLVSESSVWIDCCPWLVLCGFSICSLFALASNVSSIENSGSRALANGDCKIDRSTMSCPKELIVWLNFLRPDRASWNRDGNAMLLQFSTLVAWTTASKYVPWKLCEEMSAELWLFDATTVLPTSPPEWELKDKLIQKRRVAPPMKRPGSAREQLTRW